MADSPVAFGQPLAAELVLCRFPQDLRRPRPGPKERPAIILRVYEAMPKEAFVRVQVCYGTSNLGRLYLHEFEILRSQHADEFVSAGLSFDTKFDLRQQVTLPYTSEWFKVPERMPFGACPKLGVLHPLTVPRLVKAGRAAGL